MRAVGYIFGDTEQRARTRWCASHPLAAPHRSAQRSTCSFGRREAESQALDLPPGVRPYSDRVEPSGLLIGEVAARSGLSRKALRLYEARGILPAPRRTSAGYRRYPAEALGLLTFVGQARRLGLTLADIGQIMVLRRAGSAPCAHVRRLLEQRAAELDDMLQGIRRILAEWRSPGDDAAAVCPHIEARGGDLAWKRSRSRSAPTASTVRRSSLMATKSRSGRRGIRSGSRKRSGTSSWT